ncbi:MAG: SH3 domain-containing protein [Roseiflexaceae bacterium]|jgi:hypothetical protein
MSQQQGPQWHEQQEQSYDYPPIQEDHRRTTQRATYSRTSTWREIFMMGGWRLILALVLLVFIFVVWALLSDQPSNDVVDTVPVDTPAIDVTPLPTLTLTADTQLPQVRVSGTGTSGLFMRSAASRSAQAIKTLPEGATLEIIGENTIDGTTTWLHVRDNTGDEGWVAQSFTVPIE